jgi:Ca2+-transporting ATPase
MMQEKKYYDLSASEVERELRTNVESGLSHQEATKRAEEFGYNEFAKTKHTSLVVKFLSQFKSFMIIVLLVAAVVSGVIGYMHGEGFTDAIIILVIVLLNAIIGTAQETKAERSLDALERLSSPHCKVIRDGQIHIIESRELVPGDVVILETGDSVPADMRLTEAVNLKIEEAALTGESVPVDKNSETITGEVPLGDRFNMAFGSTSVTYGRGKGIVVATGMASEVGKIASMIQSVPETKTPMQERLDKLGRVLAIAALAICLVIFIVGVIYGRDLLGMFMTAVSLAVAAIPEGLPAVATIVLAVGVQRLVRKNAIVRKLPSVETLGSTQVICSDKTGTLTQNRMTVVKIYCDGRAVDAAELSPADLEEFTPLIDYSILANDAKLSEDEGVLKAIGDPTETAMLDLGLKYGIDKNTLEATEPRVAEIPFDSERKMMTTVHRQANGALLIATKGGVDETLAVCDRIWNNGTVIPLTDSERHAIEKQNRAMAGEALRVLAVAMNEIAALPTEVSPQTVERGLVFVGMLGMIDPPREEVRVAVSKCLTAGIKPVMITGDHKITATAIARQLGIMRAGDEAITGVELAAMSDSELAANINKTAVYARVSPEHKVRIVKAFQNEGKIVAMTGDGVNDAPALKLADIGVAMGITGTDVSKEAADVVLTDDNFATIVTAVEEGRRIYDNILKAIQFLLSTNIGEVLVLFVAVLLNWDSPLLPIHILWVNLVTDSLPALALSVEPAEPDIMRRPPIDSRRGIMTRGFATRIVLQGVMIGGLSLIANRIGNASSTEIAQTMTFAVVAFSQITLVLGIRSAKYSAFRNMFANKYLWGALVVVSAMMWVVLEVPALKTIFHVADLNLTQWAWVLGLSAIPLLVTEFVKLAVRLFTRKK